jgi:hypothetical protein
MADVFGVPELQSFEGATFALQFKLSGPGHISYTPIVVGGMTP